MKLLILGGTVFLGRHIVSEALKLGHDVTLFNRGQSNPDLFEGKVTRITGDRVVDIDQLSGLKFDACIDPSGYLPGVVGDSTRALADAIETYVFVSSISVYPEFTLDMDEGSPLSVLAEDGDPTVYRQNDYGALKVLCEKAAEAAMPGRVLQVRSGLIVGPHDPTHRFTYWPSRIAKGGQVLLPANPDWPIQFVDARDQALWILKMIEAKQTGIYNVTSPWRAYTLGHLVEACQKATGTQIEPIWIDEAFLTEHKVAPWMGLPLWLPEKMINMNRVSVDKAIDTGLTIRPIEETVSDTFNWFLSVDDQDWPAGITSEKESEVLTAWQAKM